MAMLRPHYAVVVPPSRLAAQSATLARDCCSNGQTVVLLYGAAVEAAEITIELQASDPDLLSDDGPVAFVHHGGGAAALRAAGDKIGQRSDVPPSLLVVHPLARPASVRRAACAAAVIGGRRPLAWSSTVCLFGAVHAATLGLPDLAGHPNVEIDGVDVRLGNPEGRLLALDLLLNLLDEPAIIHQLAASPLVAQLERASVNRVVHRRLAALRAVSNPPHPAGGLPDAATEIRTALLATDGQLDELLRCAQEFQCRETIVEDPYFAPLAWFPHRPRPQSLAELITEGRLARLVRQLTPGSPEVVRLGAPSVGQRVVMRIGAQQVLGFVSVAGVRPDEVDTVAGWLRQAAPLLAAELTRRRSWQRLRAESRGQLITLLSHGLLSVPSARRALEELVGTGNARVATLCASTRHGAGHPGTATDPIPITEHLDRLRVPYGEFQGQPVVLLGDAETAVRDLAASIAHLPVAVGLGSIASDPGDLLTSARQANWTCRMALATGQRLLDFNDIGIHRLFLPGAEGGDPGFERPIESLELLHEELGFDAVHTLTSYLDTGGNMRRTADQMTIHVNTLRYRLGRIAKVIGVDLTDPEQRFRLQLAVRLRAGRRALLESYSPMSPDTPAEGRDPPRPKMTR